MFAISKKANIFLTILVFMFSCTLVSVLLHPIDHNVSKPNQSQTRSPAKEFNCNTIDGFKDLKSQIRSHESDVKRIINFVLDGVEKHSTYNELAFFCDTFGPRLSGSQSLQSAIDYMSKKMSDGSKLKVRAERVMIPKWEVGEQFAEIIEPVPHKMSILALGGSVATNKTLEADAILVHSFDELKRFGQESKVNGKIVVYNYKFTNYPTSVAFRTRGAIEAAKYGAIAALVRSVAPFSIYSAHTGLGSRSIPTAAITIEDADLIERWVGRNKRVVLKLFIDTRQFDDVESYNLVGDIVGSERPDEIVLVSGHIDSWYNTAGAMDDGGGMMISYKALDVLNKLNLKGKRTIRAVLWTSEEFGLIGAQQYFDSHKSELENFKVVIESDEGTFKPLGLSFKNVGQLGQCVLRETLNLTSSIGTSTLNDKFEGSDIELFTDAGTPGLSLLNENSKYFYFHHSSGDAITVEDPDDLDRSTALFAAASYVLANLDVDLRK